MISMLINGGNYFQVFRRFNLIVSNFDEFVILQHLINIGAMVNADRNDGWFECSVSQIEEMFGKLADRNVQTRVLGSLATKKLIRTEKRGIPAKRHVYVELEYILELLMRIDDPQPQDDCEPSQPVNCKSSQLVNAEPSPLSTSKLQTTKPLAPSEQPRRSAAHPPATGRGGSLLPEGETGQASLPETCARRLRSIIVNSLKYQKPYSQASWSNEFRLLLKEIDRDESRLVRTLDWYEKNAATMKFPVVSAAKFRSRFIEIESRMKETTSLEIEVSDVAAEIAGNLIAECRWPAKAASQMPQAVQSGLDDYAPVYKKFMSLTKTLKKQDRLYGFVRSLISRMTKPVTFIARWMMTVFDGVKNWKAWSGDLKSYAFLADGDRFREWGEKLATQYGDRRLWAKLMEKLS